MLQAGRLERQNRNHTHGKENARLQEYRKYIEQTYEEILRTQGVVSAEIIRTG